MERSNLVLMRPLLYTIAELHTRARMCSLCAVDAASRAVRHCVPQPDSQRTMRAPVITVITHHASGSSRPTTRVDALLGRRVCAGEDEEQARRVGTRYRKRAGSACAWTRPRPRSASHPCAPRPSAGWAGCPMARTVFQRFGLGRGLGRGRVNDRRGQVTTCIRWVRNRNRDRE